MVLQHSSVSKSLHWHVIVILFNAKVGIFPLSSAVIVPSFISCFHYFYCLDPYYNLKFLFYCYRTQLYMYDCSIRVTVVLEYF